MNNKNKILIHVEEIEEKISKLIRGYQIVNGKGDPLYMSLELNFQTGHFKTLKTTINKRID